MLVRKLYKSFSNLSIRSIRLIRCLEECQLLLFPFDALHGFVVVFLVQLEADEVPMLLQTRNGRCATAHAVVQNYPPRIGVCQYEIAEQVNGLLGGVDVFCHIMFFLYVDN